MGLWPAHFTVHKTIILHTKGHEFRLDMKKGSTIHTGRNCFNLFQISFSANTADAHPGVSGMSKEQKFCEKFKDTHCHVDHPAKME